MKKQRATQNFTASATEIQCNPHTSALRIIIILGSLKWGAERISHSNRREDCLLQADLKTEFQIWRQPYFVEMKEDNEQLRNMMM